MTHPVRLAMLLLALLILAGLALRWYWLYRLVRRSANVLQPMQAQTDGADGYDRVDPLMERLQGLQSDTAVLPMASAAGGQVGDRPAQLDALIDSVVTLDLEQAVQGHAVLNLMPHTRRVGSKPWVVEGLNAQTQHWEPIQANRDYAQLQAGLQLANRHGAINEVEFSEFVVKAQGLADVLGASVNFPEMLQEVARARELDQFASSHDIRISLKLQAKRAAWSLGYIQQHAYRLGFNRGSTAGRWVLQDMVSLSIDSHAALSDDAQSAPISTMILSLDVPQVAKQSQPFDLMADTAVRLCASMEASMLDEQDCPVDIGALQRSAAELDRIYDRLESHGIAAGSLLAKRLFA